MNLFTTSDGTALNYRTSGEGNAIVMIHTAFDNLTVFDIIEENFTDDNQVILVDLRVTDTLTNHNILISRNMLKILRAIRLFICHTSIIDWS